MRTETVSLLHQTAGRPIAVALAEPTGRDEIGIDGVDTRSTVDLLRRLLPDTDATQLAAADRDALLAALHRQCWGDRIVATLTCVSCNRPFDLSFELSAIQRHLATRDTPWFAGAGRVMNPGGRSYVVPRASDEMAAAALGPAAGVAHLATVAGVLDDIEEASVALDAAAPTIDLDLDATCADCGHEQLAHFDLQSYVLQRLLNERNALLAEVHVLATRYGWSLDEILGLRRTTRRSLAAMAGGDTRTVAVEPAVRRGRP